ncbi:phosphoenolpyruvate--protein phosphotransferase [Ferrimonas gelatinilytica]|uniref:phosphoenolpyruvate--protein phosphotransferase n=1 Tax=Ferrimonas gelatinilytica TaxID=1255257 RepID=A0ABP9RRX6_9GAMM
MTATKSAVLQLLSPMTGIACPLAQVPDPAFAQRLVGDGYAIDPTESLLCAPCDGTVTQVHPACHAVTLTTDSGAELLIHVGVDTVKLGGEGFTARVQQGERVTAKTPLLELDLDRIAMKARSLRTVVLLTDQDRILSLTPTEEAFVRVGDPLFSVEFKASADGDAPAAQDLESMQASESVRIINPVGLHARPAAALAAIAKRFDSAVLLKKDESVVNARSVVALMGLNVAFADEVQVLAQGEDAEAAIRAVVAGLESGLGEAGAEPGRAEAQAELDLYAEPSLLFAQDDEEGTLRGVEAAPGQVHGTLFVANSELPQVVKQGSGVGQEREALTQAVETAGKTLEETVADLRAKGMGQKADIFVAHQELLSDPDLFDAAMAAIAQGQSAGYAWAEAVSEQAKQLASMDNVVLAGRAADLRDVGERVSRLLAGLPQRAIPSDLPAGTILVARELTPSDTAELDPERVVGMVTVQGGSASHSAILARALGIAALTGVDERVLELHDTPALLDTGAGLLSLNPSGAQLMALAQHQEQQAQRDAEAFASKDEPAITRDGVRIEVAGNIAKAEDALKLVANGGEAVGLLRTEFLYEASPVFPSESEQEQSIRAVLAALESRPLVVRTLDVGGDKPLPYLPLPKEDNPFLGERGLRVGLDKPVVLRQQLRALLKASDAGRVRIMFPMVSSLFELKLAKRILAQEAEALGVNLDDIEVGIMIEVPSAALMADVLAPHVDFFSIGTNDLTQYTLAIDRGHPKLAAIADGLHPAVLRLIKATTDAARKAGKWTGVCGGLAGERDAVPLLVGLGVDELSCSVPVIPQVKQQVRNLSREACESLADAAMACADAAEVRAQMQAFHATLDGH